MNIEKIVIHHSAVATWDNNEQFDAIKRYHVYTKWWGDIGYHYFLEPDGVLKNGRDEKYRGAHVGRYWNDRSLGICLAGNFNKQKPTRVQLLALKELLIDIKSRYPKAEIVLHRDLKASECPGANFTHKTLEELISGVSAVDFGLMKRFEGKYIQRVRNNIGQVYRVDNGRIVHLPASPSPLFRSWSDELEDDGKLIGITEATWDKVKKALI